MEDLFARVNETAHLAELLLMWQHGRRDDTLGIEMRERLNAHSLAPLLRTLNYGREMKEGDTIRMDYVQYRVDVPSPEVRRQWLTTLTDLLAPKVESSRLGSGEVIQILRREEVEAVWTQFQEQHVPRYHHPFMFEGLDTPLYVAFALSQIHGPSWATSVEGRHIQRVLRPWPSRLHETHEPLVSNLGKLSVNTVAWACKRGSPLTLLYLEVVGRQTLIRAGYSALLDKKRARAELCMHPRHTGYYDPYSGRRYEAQREEGSGKWEIFFNETPLPRAYSLAHAVMLHPCYFRTEFGQGFFYLTGLDGTIDWQHVWYQLDAMLTVAVKREWTELLWHRGQDQKLITECLTHGCKAWWVEPNEERWTQLVSQVAGGSGTIEIIGLDAKAPVAPPEQADDEPPAADFIYEDDVDVAASED